MNITERIKKFNLLVLKCKTHNQLMRLYNYIDYDGVLYEYSCWELLQIKMVKYYE